MMVEKVKVTDTDDYFKSVRSFDQDVTALQNQSVRFSRLVALCAVVVSIAAVAALMLLMPLKTVEPFVVRVDNSTGIVDVVTGLQGIRTYDEAVVKFFAARYVQSREGYSFAETEANFKAVSLMSAPAELQRYNDGFRGSNPLSPQVVLGRTVVARVAIKSMSVISKANNVIAVRYLKTVLRGSEDAKPTHWIATLTYGFTGDAMSTGDRLINPLGFVVSDYRAETEAQQ
jgi:type IV secretion system protein VirB8